MRKLIHKILSGASLTTALFIFQACYGVPEDPLFQEDGMAPMEFSIVSHETGQPIPGVHLWDKSYGTGDDLGVSDNSGHISATIYYRRNVRGPFLRFEDPEGAFFPKDTTLADLRFRTITIKMDSAQ